MKEITGNIWDYHKKGHWIVITTNGNVNTKGKAVMGKGIALQAKQRYFQLPTELGKKIRRYGNIPFVLPEFRIVTLPTKHNWWEKSDTQLIEIGISELERAWTLWDNKIPLYMVRPGCSSGGLDWKDVKPILEKYLDDRFVVVERGRNDTKD